MKSKALKYDNAGDKPAFSIASIVILVAATWIWTDNTRIRSLSDQNATLNHKIADYSEALSDANDNIKEANSNIEDAQSEAWSDYESMGEALDDLDTVDTVPEP